MITSVRIKAGKFKVQPTIYDGPKGATADGNRLRRVKRAVYVAPVGELADPRVLAGLAVAAEEPGDDTEPWVRAGATWIVTDFGMQPTEAEVREVIDAGPG